MSLLDELKAKADERRTDAELEAARLEEQAAFYQAELLPRMLATYNFLKEFSAHLNVVDEPCELSYPILPEEKAVTLYQGEYSVAIDSRQEPTQVELRCTATLPEAVTYEIDGKQLVERHRKMLDTYGLKYECTERKDERFELASAGFKLIGPLPVRVVFVADSASRCITVHLRNIDQAGVKTLNLSTSKFDDNFLDRVGRFVLRQQSTLFTAEISDEARRKLQDKLAEQREEEERARRVLEAERAELEKAKFESRASVKLSRAVQSAASKLKARLSKD